MFHTPAWFWGQKLIYSRRCIWLGSKYPQVLLDAPFSLFLCTTKHQVMILTLVCLMRTLAKRRNKCYYPCTFHLSLSHRRNVAWFLNPSSHFSLYQNEVRTFRKNVKQNPKTNGNFYFDHVHPVLTHSCIKLDFCLLKMLFKARSTSQNESSCQSPPCSCSEALWAHFGGGCDAAGVVRAPESHWGSLVWWNKASFVGFSAQMNHTIIKLTLHSLCFIEPESSHALQVHRTWA